MVSQTSSCRAARHSVAALLLVLLALAGSTGARAQEAPIPPDLLDMSLDELLEIEIDSVSGASGFEQKVTEAPASVTIITSEDIRTYGYKTLADILRTVRGFHVSYDRNYSYLGVRGYGPPGDYNSRIALLIDGHRANENIFDGNPIGPEFPIDVDLIDRVEVIRGPNSSLYVASAFLGVINIITKRWQDLHGVNVAVAAASYGTYQGRVSYGNKFRNGLELLLSTSVYDSRGQHRLFFKEFDAPATNNGIAVDADDEKFRQFFATVSLGGFTLRGVFGSREKGIPTAPFGTVFNDAGTRTVDERVYLDLQYRRKLGRGWSLTDRVYYDRSTNDGDYIYDQSASGGPSRVVNKNFAHGQWWGNELTVSKRLFEKQRISIGAEYRDNFQQDQGNYDVQPFVQYLSDSRSSSVVSVYAQDEIRLRKNLVLNLGLRYDRYSTFGDTTNPRAALIYSPFARTTLKLLYGQSFRAPNLFELYYAAPGNEVNPALQPETVKTTELVWEQYFAKHYGMTVSAFYYPIRGLIAQELNPGTGNVFFANSGSDDVRGMDFGLWRKLAGGVEGSLSYSYQDIAIHGSGAPAVNSPKHLVQATLSVPLIRNKLFASTDAQFVSRRATLAGEHSDAYAVANATLFSKNVFKGWEFSASVYNLFDRKYTDPRLNGGSEDTLVQDGRTFRFKAGYRF